MEYKNIIEAIFLERPNRFIAYCKIGEETIVAHVKNTGRCKELLIPGVTVYVEYAPSPKRKTDYSLIAVRKRNYVINIDSQAPNKVAMEGIEQGIIQLPNIKGEITKLKREVTYGNSRFDLYVETTFGQKIFIEVKGVTLEKDGVVMFPDAPTKRGTKHIYELIEATKEEYEACILFVIQLSPVTYFTPNKETDMALAEALQKAKQEGVEVIAYDCMTTPQNIEISMPVEVRV